MTPSILREVARQTDRETAEARARLIRAVRRASADGMTQTQIATEIGRSQPEVSRLLRFHGTSPLARRLRAHAGEIKSGIAAVGGGRVRVFGSVALGADRPDSDIDLLFEMRRPLSLMQLNRLEAKISDIVGVPVDLVPENALRPDLRDRVLEEAVAL